MMSSEREMVQKESGSKPLDEAPVAEFWARVGTARARSKAKKHAWIEKKPGVFEVVCTPGKRYMPGLRTKNPGNRACRLCTRVLEGEPKGNAVTTVDIPENPALVPAFDGSRLEQHTRKAMMEARVWEKVVDTPGCWYWEGAVGPDGLPRVYYAEKKRSVWRVLHEIMIGELPRYKHYHPACGDWRCVNPKHYRPGNKLKSECKRGHKFTPENTKNRSGGKRACRQCARASDRRWNRQRKLERTRAKASEQEADGKGE